MEAGQGRFDSCIPYSSRERSGVTQLAEWLAVNQLVRVRGLPPELLDLG